MYDSETFTHDGAQFRVTFPYDDSSEAPWEREEGHGPVSEWRRGHYGERARKAPGERALCIDGHAARFYDFAEAVRIARRDGWGFLPGKLATRLIGPGSWEATAGKFSGYGPDSNTAIRDLYAQHKASMTPRAYAAGAAEADFERLRQWCNDEWTYVGIVVDLLDDEGDPMGETESLWGIESDASEYLDEVAHELAGEILHRLKAAAA